MPGLLVTGTDTGVGKTAVACGILAALRRRGLRAAPFKPVESGHTGPEGSWPPDARCLREASGTTLRREQVVPYVLREPLAPAVGAELDGTDVDAGRIAEAYRDLEEAHDLVVVEGAGGIAVPLRWGFTMAHFAAQSRMPALIVCRPGLGTLNHTVLTADWARRRGLDVLGLVVNGMPPEPDLAQRTNPAALAKATGLAVLGVVPQVNVDIDAGRWQAAAEAVRTHVDLERILGLARRRPSSPPAA